MPRLVGKKSDLALYFGLGLLIAVTGAVSLEYFGVTDYIPNFGKANTTSLNQPLQFNKPVN